MINKKIKQHLSKFYVTLRTASYYSTFWCRILIALSIYSIPLMWSISCWIILASNHLYFFSICLPYISWNFIFTQSYLSTFHSNPGKLKHHSMSTTVFWLCSITSGLMIIWSHAIFNHLGVFFHRVTKMTLSDTPIWGAATHTPSLLWQMSFISRASCTISLSKCFTGSATDLKIGLVAHVRIL